MDPLQGEPVRFVTQTKIRELFTESGLEERILADELPSLVVEEGYASPKSRQPRGTRSQRMLYFDRGSPVAECHLFVHPDGTAGASQLPDPKELRLDGVRYVCD